MSKDFHLHPLQEDELELGITLPWTVYSAAGQLLMREGAAVDTQRKLDNLLTNGHREKEGKPPSEDDEEEGPPADEPQPVNFHANTNPFSELDEILAEQGITRRNRNHRDSGLHGTQHIPPPLLFGDLRLLLVGAGLFPGGLGLALFPCRHTAEET